MTDWFYLFGNLKQKSILAKTIAPKPLHTFSMKICGAVSEIQIIRIYQQESHIESFKNIRSILD